MLMHVLGLIYTFIFAALVSTGVSLAPVAVAWSSLWTYLAFAACLIPGYIAAWLTIIITIGVASLFALGLIAIVSGGATTIHSVLQKNRR